MTTRPPAHQHRWNSEHPGSKLSSWNQEPGLFVLHLPAVRQRRRGGRDWSLPFLLLFPPGLSLSLPSVVIHLTLVAEGKASWRPPALLGKAARGSKTRHFHDEALSRCLMNRSKKLPPPKDTVQSVYLKNATLTVCVCVCL